MYKLLFLLFLTKTLANPILPEQSQTTTEEPQDLPLFLQGPELFPENRTHNLYIGKCRPNDELVHSETIIINNDGTSITAGGIQINVEGPVFITCVSVFDNLNENGTSGAYPMYLGGGVGHNYVVLGFRSAYGYGANFYIEIRGIEAKSSKINVIDDSSVKNDKIE